MGAKIRFRRSDLLELNIIQIDPELRKIDGSLDGEDLFIFNEMHLARGFRKIHLEIAKMGGGIEVLHCVLFPDPRFNIPIFGADVVVVNSTVTAAIVDLSPVGSDLPIPIKTQLSKNQTHTFLHPRKLPPWGNIFSEYVCFIRPQNKEEEVRFCELVDTFLAIIISYSHSIEPDEIDSSSTIQRHNYQSRYCLQQKQNDKTRNVLAQAFNPQWADRYIDLFLFDSP